MHRLTGIHEVAGSVLGSINSVDRIIQLTTFDMTLMCWLGRKTTKQTHKKAKIWANNEIFLMALSKF